VNLCPSVVENSRLPPSLPCSSSGLASKKRTEKEEVHGLVVLVFEVNRAEVMEGAVETVAVIKHLDEVEDGEAGLVSSLEGAPIDQFLFEGAPERFHGGVVVTVAFPAHGRECMAAGQSVTEITTGILAATVGVEDQLGSRLAVSQSHIPSREDELGVDVLAHGPADDAATEAVHNAGQVEPAFLCVDVSDVADPDLVGCGGGRQVGQAIGSNGMVMVAVSGADPEAAFDPPTEAFLAHEAGNAIATMRMAGLAQLRLNARAAVSLSAVPMDLEDLRRELEILTGARARMSLAVDPAVITTGGDGQGGAERSDGMFGFHRINPCVPLVGGSERMPKVFFRISRC